MSGLDAAPHPTDRLFFALYPDAEAAERIGRLALHLRDKYRLRGRALEATRFHGTLHFLGDYAGYPQAVIAAANDAAAKVSAPPFEVAFDRVSSFRRPRKLPLVLRTSEEPTVLTALHRSLVGAMKTAGLERGIESRFASRIEPHYTPHVTLLYDDRRIEEEPVETIAWTVREFVLVNSLIGRTRHVPLGRWTLRG